MSEEKPAESGPEEIDESLPGGDAGGGGEAVPEVSASGSASAEAEAGGMPDASGGAPDSEDGVEASPAAAAESPEALARALEDARREAQANMDLVLRARAELENVRKRAERDVANAHRYGLERFVSEFLPVRDSLELGVSAAGDDADVARVREGMELTLKLMAAAFDKLGVEVVDPAGEPFDPDLHQAMSMQEGEEGQSGNVLSVFQKGYRLNERLVRPALVVVAK